MKKITLHDKTFRRTIPRREIILKIKALADKLNSRWAETAQPPVFVSVLNGAFMFTAELLRHIAFPCEVVFVRLASYDGLTSNGEVRELLGLEDGRLAGREVIVLEDIVETGRTVEALHRILSRQSPESIAFSALFFKPEAYAKPYKIDYYAMKLPNDFIVGFGLDYDQLGRNLPDVYALI